MTAKCPLCFSIVDPSVKAWKCVSGQCELDEDDRALSDAYGTAVRDVPRIATSKAVQDASTPRGAWPPRTPFCPSCKSPMAEICAVCHWVLPEDWSAANVTTIAMAGARASGKSFFIAVGLTELEQLLLAHAHTQLQPFSPEVARVFRESYIEPLYVRLGVLEPTPEGTRQGAYQRQPLVFDLGQVNRRRQYLVMRDVAGEELQELKPERRHLGFLGRADAVLFLFDPLAVPEVRSSLRDVIPLPDDTGANPVAVLTNLTMLIREATGSDALPPIGVIMSKFDSIEQFRKLEGKPEWKALMMHRGAAFARDPSENQLAYDLADAELLGAEVRSLLLRLGAHGLVAMLENPSSGRPVIHQYFATSVLGHAPSGRDLDARGIAPFRVLDPLKWVLNRSGAIEATGRS